MTRHPAIFIDRDGTLVHARHYPSRPEDLILYDGIGPGLAALRRAGFRLIVVTNQSGIARGYFTEDDLGRMHDHLRAELRRFGVELDGIEFCPHHPDGVIEHLAIRCDCRKPAPGMVSRAAAAHGLDPARSWFLGDILDDIEAGNRAGCRTILVDIGTESLPTAPIRTPDFVARDTVHALAIVAAEEGLGPATDLSYRPASWLVAGEGETRVLHAVTG
jgi:D-glycero-D-manno-heptose 1,7-bisphosphate phosphatase